MDCAFDEIRTQKMLASVDPRMRRRITRAHRPCRARVLSGRVAGWGARDGYGQIGSSSLRVLQNAVASKGRRMASLASARLRALPARSCVSALLPSAAWLPSLPVPHSAQPCQPGYRQPSQPTHPAGHQLTASFASQHPHPLTTQRQPARPRRAQPTPCTCTPAASQPASPSSPRRTVQATGHQSSPLRQLVHPPPSIHPRPTLSVQHHAPSTRCHYSPSSIHPSIHPTHHETRQPSFNHVPILSPLHHLPTHTTFNSVLGSLQAVTHKLGSRRPT